MAADMTSVQQVQHSLNTSPALPPIQSPTSSSQVTNTHQRAFESQVQPKSPSPSSQSRYLEFLSWISGRGSPSGQDSSKNSSVNFCRICHEGESGGERLISPCRCSGSVGLIHRSCIEKWLTIVNNDTCELCKQKYSVTRHPRPFSSWLCEPAVGDDQRNLVGDGVCFLLLTPLCCISAYLCASGAAFYFQQDKQSEAIGLICLSSLLVTIYMAWLVLTIRYHCQVWFKWRSNNQDIRLLNVSGQRPTAMMSRGNPRSSQPPREEQSTEGPNVVEISITSGHSGEMGDLSHSSPSSSSLASNTALVQSSSLQDIGHLVSPGQAANLAVTLEDLGEKNIECNALDVKTIKSSDLYFPLSPHIISHDPQDQSNSKVVISTEDSEIYAQIPAYCPPRENNIMLTDAAPAPTVAPVLAYYPEPVPDLSKACTSFSQLPMDHQLSIQGRAVSVPYLPDLRDHFIALRSKQEPVNKSLKSRGTFSPSRRFRNVTFSVTQVQSSDLDVHPIVNGASSRTVSKPLPPPLPVRRV